MAKRTYNDPNDYIRLRFSGQTISKTDDSVKFRQKFGIFKYQTGGIYSFVTQKDFVSQRFRLDDFTYAQQNDQRLFDRELKQWNIKHNQAGRNYDHPRHPGMPPQVLNIVIQVS